MFKSITSAFLLLGAAALWPGSVQAAICDLTTAGSNGSYMFLLDINQTQANSLLSPDQLQIYGSNTSGLTNYPFTGSATLVYDMDAGSDSWVKLDNNVSGGTSSGSGDFDMTLTLSAAQSELLSGFTHVYLLSQFGSNFANNDGYEEWVAVVPEPSVAWLLALGLVVVALRRAPLRFGSLGFGRKDLAGAADRGRNDRRAVITPTLMSESA